MQYTPEETEPVDTPDGALTVDEYREIHEEIDNQPREWRAVADREMDYAEGNQLKTELLEAQRQIGIPPSMENLIGAALEGIRGYEEATRTDWRVTANGQPSGQTCTATPPTTQCTVTGLEPGKTYTFTVDATNGAGSTAAPAPSNPATPLADAKVYTAPSPTNTGRRPRNGASPRKASIAMPLSACRGRSSTTMSPGCRW